MLNATDFTSEINGKETELVTLENGNGVKVSLTNYGARIVEMVVPDKNGNGVDVNLGHSNIQEYTKVKANYYGAVIGRVCGRIRDARFSVEENDFSLQPNNGDTFLHGGENGFHSQVFEVVQQSKSKVEFRYQSPDGDEGFPGNLSLSVTYELTDQNELMLDFQAETDKKTPINITNHAYFNLNGEGSGTMLGHQLQIFSEEYLPIRADILPTGEIASVKNTPFDFTLSKTIGKDIGQNNLQLELANGYDHTFVLKRTFTPEIKHAARAIGEQTGICLDVFTNQPGVHLYTGNFMDGSFLLKSGERDSFRTAFCLETQHLADALNQSHFPSILLQPGKIFKTKTVFRFSTIED